MIYGLCQKSRGFFFVILKYVHFDIKSKKQINVL